jgi:hypothetical protein
VLNRNDRRSLHDDGVTSAQYLVVIGNENRFPSRTGRRSYGSCDITPSPTLYKLLTGNDDTSVAFGTEQPVLSGDT